MESKHYNHKQVTVSLIYDKKVGYHYIRYRLPAIKLDNGKYQTRKFRSDENLKFVFKEGYKYTHPFDSNNRPIKLKGSVESENKKYLERINNILAERQVDISRGNYSMPSNTIKRDFFDFITKWMVDPKAKRSKQTISGYKSLIRHLKTFTGSQTLSFESINEEFVKKFQGYLNEAPSHLKSTNNGMLSGVTINRG